MMTSLRTLFWRMWPWKRNSEEEKSSLKSTESVFNRFDQYALIIENVAVWENPLVSAACVLLVNLLFWLIYSFERKFYCVLTLTLWVILFYNFWNEHVFPLMKSQWSHFAVLGDWCNRNCSTLAVKEGGRYYVHLRANVSKFYCWMLKFRLEYPGLFCVWVLIFLMFVAALGQAVPGLLLAYAACMLVLVGPGVALHLLPTSVTLRAQALHQLLMPAAGSAGGAAGDSEVDEYLPESNKETLAVLTHATDDDLCSSSHVAPPLDLDLDVSKMPPHDQESLEGSLDAPEEFELSPYEVDGILSAGCVRRRRRRGGSREGGGVGRSAEEGVMRFESAHFEQGSSSEEEALEAFSQGLCVARGEGASEQALGDQVGHLLGKLLVHSGAVASMVHGALAAQQPPLQRVSDRHSEEESDEDFEMISEEDLS